MGGARALSALAEPRQAGGVALASSSAVLAKIATPDAAASPGTLSGRPCDPYAFRRLYPHKWRDFLRAHFRSATEVEVFFSIDDKCARNWWHGKTGPQGWAVDFAREALAAPFISPATRRTA